MKKTLLLALLSQAFAISAFASDLDKAERDDTDAAAAKTAAVIKDCGHAIKVVVDWKSYDAIDWKKSGENPVQQYGAVRENLNHLGPGVNQLCADKTYQRSLSKISTVIFKPTDNDQIKLKATIAGTTLMFEDYLFGSTRDPVDYVAAAKQGL